MNCDSCGSDKTIKFGLKVLRSGKVQRYQCKTCGHVFRGKELIQNG